jgi:hypothetical protein
MVLAQPMNSSTRARCMAQWPPWLDAAFVRNTASQLLTRLRNGHHACMAWLLFPRRAGKFSSLHNDDTRGPNGRYPVHRLGKVGEHGSSRTPTNLSLEARTWRGVMQCNPHGGTSGAMLRRPTPMAGPRLRKGSGVSAGITQDQAGEMPLSHGHNRDPLHEADATGSSVQEGRAK